MQIDKWWQKIPEKFPDIEEAKENVQESKAELKQAKVDEAYPAFKKNAEELNSMINQNLLGTYRLKQ